MEAIAADSSLSIAQRDGQQLGDAGHSTVKRGIKARHLRKFGQALAASLDQRDFARQMLRIEWAEPFELRHQRRRDTL